MFQQDEKSIERNLAYAGEVYDAFGVDVDVVLDKMDKMSVSLHCWQGDDITGFEHIANGPSGGIMATGNFPGKARNADELRKDLSKALSLIPGKHRVNLHSIYAETGGKKVERDELGVEHFANWIDWAKQNGLGLDFNPTYFAHPMADSGYTLSSKDEEVRSFWVRHTERTREISVAMGKALGTPCVHNIWIPDGSKDIPADRLGHRELLVDSLDRILACEYPAVYIRDAVEGKLFGLGSESYVVGSHDFYVGYASTHPVMLCLDMGHFHPTEVVADKVSALLPYIDELLVHVSRGVRWDSDHVVILNDELMLLMQEIKRSEAFDRVHLALDFFDGSINRLMAWVIGTRAALKGIMMSMLEPTHLLLEAEMEGNNGRRLALLEEFKTLPYAAVWQAWCARWGIPGGAEWLDTVQTYEKDVLLARG